jgi:hypothetical protein
MKVPRGARPSLSPEEGHPMTHLRFSPADYRSLCRLCQARPPTGDDFAAFRRFLLDSLAETRPSLAERIAELDGHRLGILYDHFSKRAPADAARGQRHRFSGEELQVLAEACEPFHGPVRFVRYLRVALVEHLRDLFPDLARKVARLSDRQFERLYKQVTGRPGGSA